MKLQQLKESLFRINLNKHNGINLTPQEKILDVEKFVNNHISILEANSGKARYKPYYDRLLKLYNLIKE